MSEPWQHFYQSQRLRLSYWTWGEASRPPLVLVHGGRDHARSWDRVAEAFRDDYHVIACDLRGHGDSDYAKGGAYGTTEHVLDIIALIDLLGGRASVVAHSFGGAITLLAAGAFPERFERIVSIEGAGARMRPREPVTPAQLREWALRARAFEQHTPRVYPSIEEACRRMQEANPHLAPEMAMHLARWGTIGIDGGYTWKFDPWVRGRSPVELHTDELEPLWAAIACPVLHLVGGESGYGRHALEGRPVDEYFADARTVVVQGAGHWVHHDRLEDTVREIRGFLGAPPAREAAE